MTDPLFNKGMLSIQASFDSSAQAIVVAIKAGDVIEADFNYSHEGRNVQCNLKKFQSHSDEMLNLLSLLGDSLRPHLRALVNAHSIKVMRDGASLIMYPQPAPGAAFNASAAPLALLKGENGEFEGEGTDELIDVLTVLHFVSM